MSKQVSVGSWIAAIVVVLVVIAGGAYLANKAMHPSEPVEAAAPASSSTVATTTATPIEHPIDQAQINPATASTAPLPALNDSDSSVAAALSKLVGGSGLDALLVSQQIIPRIVATIDALPRHDGMSTFLLPAHPPKGSFVTANEKGQTFVSEKNAVRYAPYMRVIEQVDSQALVDWYVRYYPLFQQAYKQLGYPKAYFNDRLIVVIDDLLAAPQASSSAQLAPSKSYYVYRDPALESRSTGQKLMMRAGSANEATIKAKLQAIRADLTTRNLHGTPAAASSVGGDGQ